MMTSTIDLLRLYINKQLKMDPRKINSISKYHINNNLRHVHFDTFNKALQRSMNNECNLKHFPREHEWFINRTE